MKLPIWRHVRQRLSTQVVLLMVAILVLTMAGGLYVLQRDLRGQLNDQVEYRALSVAQPLAGERSVAEQAAVGRPGGQLQVLATQVQQETNALFVVITNAQASASPTRPRRSSAPRSPTRTPSRPPLSRSAPAVPGSACSTARSARSRRARCRYG